MQQQPASSSTGGVRPVDRAPAVAAAGFAAVIVGSIGPWVTTPLSSAAGTDGDGVITLILGAVGLLLVASKHMMGARLVGLAAFGVGLYEAIHIHNRAQHITAFGVQVAHVGWGVYVVMGGAVAAMLMLAGRKTPDAG